MQTVDGSRRLDALRLRTFVTSPDFVLSAVSYALIAAMCLHWMHPGSVIETGDNYWQYRPWHAMLRGLAAWNHLNTVDGARNVGFYAIPWALPTAFLTFIGGESFAQVAMLALMRAVEWSGAYVLCRRIGAGRTASFTAAWALVLNPYAHTLTINAPVFDWTVACFVWIGWAFVAAAREQRRRPFAAFVLAAVAAVPLAFLSQNPGLILTAAIGAIFLFGLGVVVARDRAAYTRWSAGVALAMLVASLWWIAPTANYVLGSTVTADTNVTGYDWVVANSSLLNNLRFIPTWAWSYATYFPYAKAFDSNPFSYSTGFCIALLVGFGLATVRGRKSSIARYCAIVGLSMLFVSKGEHGPLQELNTLLYRLPGLVVFREPTSKTPLVALVFFVPIVAFAIDSAGLRIAIWLRASKALGVSAFAGAVLIATAISAYPLLTGEVFHGATPGLPSVYVSLPSYWRDAGVFLNDRRDRGALMVLPSDTFYQASYSWGYYGYDSLPFLMFDRHVENEILGTYTQTPAVNAIAERIVEAIRQRSPLSRTMLADFGVRYLLYRNDLHVAGAATPSEAAVLSIPGASVVRRFGPLDVVDVGDPGPDVSETTDWIATSSTPEADATLELRALFERLPRVDGTAAGVMSLHPPVVFEKAVTSERTPPANSMEAAAPTRFVATDSVEATRLMRGREEAPATMSFLRPAIEPVVTRVSTSERAPRHQDDEAPLLHAGAPSQTGQITIFNPARVPVRFDLYATVQSTHDSVYSITGGGGHWRSMPVRGDAQPTSARFVDLIALPGPNVFSFASERGDGAALGDVHFAKPRQVSNPSNSPVVASLGGVSLNAPADTIMSVRLEMTSANPARAFAAVARLSYGGRAYSCYSVFGPNGDDDTLAADIASCLQQDLFVRQLSVDDVSQTIVQRLDFEGSVLPRRLSRPVNDDIISVALELNRAATTLIARNLRDRSIPRWTDPRLSLLTTGASKRPYDPQVGEDVRFAADGVTVTRRKSESATAAILTTREVFDPEWSALCLGRCSAFPPHVRVDGYRNGWIVSGSGTIVLFQNIVFLQACLAVVSLATILWLGSRMRLSNAT